MNRQKLNSDIDFVLLWVDGNDPEWQKERNKYKGGDGTDTTLVRYRDWQNIQYWFRAVESFAPWVRKIHFVTCGHLPKWLNTNHPKLNIVKHSDFIPMQYLPTFSSRTIDLNLHRIEGISDQFVYFNDDMFLCKPVAAKDFFRNGLPCDSLISNCRHWMVGDEYYAPMHNDKLINAHFDKYKCIKSNPSKWFNWRYGSKNLASLCLLPWRNFKGFYDFHVPYSYLKSSYEAVWKEEYNELDKACKHKFRSNEDINHWLISYWQLAMGCFSPRSLKLSKYHILSNSEEINQCVKDIRTQKYKLICVNDSKSLMDFEGAKEEIINAFDFILPKKSEFEI